MRLYYALFQTGAKVAVFWTIVDAVNKHAGLWIGRAVALKCPTLPTTEPLKEYIARAAERT